jgi:hypothetical protein
LANAGALCFICAATRGADVALQMLVWFVAAGDVCAPCAELFSVEFVEASVACNVSNTNCTCQFRLLDLNACAISNSGHLYNLTVLNSGNPSSNKYTESCWKALQLQDVCMVQGIRDLGNQISPIEIVFTALGVVLEFISVYEMVSN